MTAYFPIYSYAFLTSLDMALTLLGIHLNIASEGNPLGVSGVAVLKILSVGLIFLIYQYRPKYGRLVASIGSSAALVCVLLWASLFAVRGY
jgi:hypothetical protein